MNEQTSSIEPAKTALLVMDYQTGILANLQDSAGLVARAKEAIAFARSKSIQIGYVRVAFEEADLKAIPPYSAMARVASMGSAFTADAPATQVHPDIAPQDGDIVVRKVRVGAFSTTDLDRQLRERGITTLFLAGVSTSGVVLSTVRDGADRDYRIFVISDLCADPQPDVHSLLLEKVFPRQAQVISSGELRFFLSATVPQ